MCGINGYFGDDNSELIYKMNSSINHRGPDNSSVFTKKDKKISLGHTRLSIIDLSSSSNQPITSNNSRYTLVFNGEIYNFKEIKSLLLKKNYKFRSKGDAEVLLNLWIECGLESLSMIDGIFSFAMYDKHENSLYIARDHFGIKPLYFSEIGEKIYFSSEIKALLESYDIPRTIDNGAVHNYLQYLWNPGESTILKSVKRVKPGFVRKYIDGKFFEEICYYKVPEYNPHYSFNESLSILTEQIEKSVESQLISDVPVGAFLSGGLDSSLICSIAKSKDTEFAEVFTIDTGSKNDGFEEDLPYAKKVANRLKLNLNISKTQSNDIDDLPECIFYLDEPQADPAIINTYKICKLAKQKDIKVLFSGSGGDDIFTGYRRHILASKQKWINFIPKPIKRFVIYISKYLSSDSIFGRRAKKVSEVLNYSGDRAIVSYFEWISSARLKKLFKSNPYKDGDAGLIERLISGKDVNNIEKTLMVDRAYFLTDHNLNYTDKMSMAHGVEVRVPFINRDILEIASKIPTHFKQKGSTGKFILKEMAKKYLPHEVIYRPKTGFGSPLRDWINGPLEPLIDKLLSKDVIEMRGLFNYTEVKELIEENKFGKGDYAYTIYALMTLEIWMRQFIDPPSPKKLTMKDLLN